MQHSILSRHYQNYLEAINSQNYRSYSLTDIEIQKLSHKKYNLTEFDIYKYVTALDHIKDSLNSNINLTEGITNDKNKYNNILVDLYYKNIPLEIIKNYPISIVFNIKQEGNIIRDLTKADIDSWKGHMYWNLYSLEGDDINPYQELEKYKAAYLKYGGNSYTYYVFKQLVKLLLTEVCLYNYNGYILTYKELINKYRFILYKTDPGSLKSIAELIESGEITKVKYQCIKVTERVEPEVINYLPISELRLFLVDVSKLMNFEESYNTLIEKSFNDFWDYDQENLNKQFIKNLNETTEFKSKIKAMLLKKF